jgi:hypothetical protein
MIASMVLLLLHIFLARGRCLSSRCLATIHDDKYTDFDEEFIKYAVEMGSGTMIQITSLMKTGLGIQKLIHKNADNYVIS